MTRRSRACAVAAALLALGACGEQTMRPDSTARLPALADITPAQWERLAQRRLFFGHQSVGGNLMQGVQEVLAANPAIPLKVFESTDPAKMTAPGIYHGLIGANGQPSTKLAQWRDVAAGMGDSVTALVKYCYVDITSDTDPAELFRQYQQTVDSLRREHPSLRIVHVTLPLQVDPGTFFHWRTVMRGKVTPYRTLNAIRARYNDLMRNAYAGEPLFDLAHLESVTSTGEVAVAKYKGLQVPSLASEWTYDGGHLNEAGRRRLGEIFLATLARIEAQGP